MNRYPKNLHNQNGVDQPQRKFVGCLCEDVEHLHVHLIPRYTFTEHDKKIFRELYNYQLSEEEIEDKIRDDKMGGFWHIAERERDYKKVEPWIIQKEDDWLKYFKDLAGELRLSIV